MNTDFRVSTGWLDHPKTKRLIARCGRDGAFSLLALWSWTARVMPTGNLGEITDHELEEAADWQGEHGQFAAACFELGWLDRRPDGIRIHGWKEHNGYASGAATRIRSARHAVNERWRKQRERKELIRSYMPSSSSLPSPSLSVTSSEEETLNRPASRNGATGFEEFWKAYPKKVGKQESLKAWKLLHTTDELRGSIMAGLEGYKRSEQVARGFILDPVRFLKRRRWEDEPVPSNGNGSLPKRREPSIYPCGTCGKTGYCEHFPEYPEAHRV